ncbi:GNAT family N-acetyltransferase [Flavobacterium cerinum]|uniref:N-acetyltransferase n=1 Tax=Flavobacterium cerinum TaxID=2502784 RepID=A0A3S3QMF3_9FLAO|nr:GNAT family N-acetyltransferase [Flavobacterium cerinum]RWX02525.1 N-acetyltransferase [Flavobacterium cerinum]
MSKSIETERLYFRELEPTDDAGMFELDSNPEVHTYLGKNPVKTIDESRAAIAFIREQYHTNGIGRWAALLKDTGEFIGWAGLKLERNVNGHDSHYDLGYRFIQKHWGKGYASEAAAAFVDYGFYVMKLEKINATADPSNAASRKVLERVGLKFIEIFDHEGEEEVWYEMVNPNK